MTANVVTELKRIATALEGLTMMLAPIFAPMVITHRSDAEPDVLEPPDPSPRPIGRASTDTDTDLERVMKIRSEGFETYNAISIALNERGIRRQNGQPFHPVTVKRLLKAEGISSKRAELPPGMRRNRKPIETEDRQFLDAMPKGDHFDDLLSSQTLLRSRAFRRFREENFRNPTRKELDELMELAS